MAAQAQRMALKEILIDDSDQFLKPEAGEKPEALVEIEREVTRKSQTRGSLNELKLDDSPNQSGRGSCPRDLGSLLPRTRSASKRSQVDRRVRLGFREAALRELKNPFGSRRPEDATVVLHRVKDPRSILSSVEGLSKVRTAANDCEALDMAEEQLKETLDPIDVNSEEESEFVTAADSQECSMDITQSSSMDILELSLFNGEESVSIVGVGDLEDGCITRTDQDSSNSSILKEDEMTLENPDFSEKPTISSDLRDAATGSSAKLSSDGPVIWNSCEDSMLSASLSQSSSSVEAELHPAQSSETYNLPTPISMTTSPEDTSWWNHLPSRQEFEAEDEKRDADAEVMVNYSRMSNFEAYSGLSGLELASDLNGPNEMDDTGKSLKKKPKRLLRNSRCEPDCPKTPSDKGSTKRRYCTRTSRLNRISGVEESETKDAVECSKEGVGSCEESERSESKGVLTEREREIKAEIKDQDVAGGRLKFEDDAAVDVVCRPMSLRSRRSSVIHDVSLTCAKLDFVECKTEMQLGDLSSQEEIKIQSQHSVRKADKKLRAKRPPLLHRDWLVGDLLWAKMAGHPWWPCMLTYDPSLGLYTRSSTVGKVFRTRYHVRFFGEKPYRAWIGDGSILRYKGAEAFQRLCAQMLTTDLVHRSPSYYMVKECRRRAWDAAVEEAERICRLSRKDRLLKCNSVSGADSSRKSVVAVDETWRGRKERGKSLSHERTERKTSEWKRRRRSESNVEMKLNAKDSLGPDDSRKLKTKKEDQNSNCSKRRESTPEVLRLYGSGGAGSGIRKGNVCLTCEEEVSDEELISCEGSCLGSFHRACLGLAVGLLMPFVCDECTTGSHTCFVCKVTSVETVRCSVSLCGRFYHLECVKKLRLAHADKRRLQCPLHACATCTTDDIKNPLASKGSLLRCVRCPTAYHSSDFCLAAGSERLPGNSIICSRHLSKLTLSQQHVNVNWCFLCSKGGTLLCCESCPAAFHMDCLEITSPPAGSWECEECVDGKRPLYGEIVWAKLGKYRWWPGEIYHPRNIPDSLMGAPHQEGEFPVRFFGTHNYFWANIGRVFLFQEDDKGSKESIRNGLDKSFSRAVQEANVAIRVWMEEKGKRDEKSKAKADRKPPPYKHLKSSIAVGDVSVYRFNLDDIHPCSCHSDMVDPCGPESKCLNRDLSYECHPDVCPVGDRCQNRRFQRREYVSVVPFKTENRGWGLKTLVDVKQGQFVIEYVGELIDHDECRRRMKEMQTRKNSSFYLLTLDKDRIIDAGPRGNVSRFMNHSCLPNCETQKWTVNGDSRIGLFSIVDIPAGSELTFNYNLDCLGNEKLACHCGSAICSGYLGLRPKQSTAVLSESLKKKKKRRMKKNFGTVHEDDCFRCGKTGQLIMCDKIQCPKVYHIKCLHLKKPPHGKWICPWHHCDECGQPSTQLCNECDNSFCVDHCDGNIAEMLPGYLVCSEHDEWKPPADDPSYVETGLRDEDSRSEELVSSETEGIDSMLKKFMERKRKGSRENAEMKKNRRRSSFGICQKDANGKRKKARICEKSTSGKRKRESICEKNANSKRKRERDLPTNALIKSEGEANLASLSATPKRHFCGKGSAKRITMLSPNVLSQGKDGLKLKRAEKKTFRNVASCQRKRSVSTSSSSAVSEKDSTHKHPTKRRQRKSLPENRIQIEDVTECFGTESRRMSDVSSTGNSKRRKTISVMNCNGVAKLKRKVEKRSGDPTKNADVAELLMVRARKGNQERKRNSKKFSISGIPAKRPKTECVEENGDATATIDSVEAGIRSVIESRKKPVKIRDSKKGKKIREVLKKTVRGVRVQSRKETRPSKKSLASLNSVASQKKKLPRSKDSDFPLKISNTSRKDSTLSACSKDLQKVLKTKKSRMQCEKEFRNNAAKSFGRKLKLGEAKRSRKGGRFTKQSDNDDDTKMETEEETIIKCIDVAQVETNKAFKAPQIPSLKTDESSAQLLDISIAEHVDITRESENEAAQHPEVAGEKSKVEDLTILNVQDEIVASPMKLTKQIVLKDEGSSFRSGKRVVCKQSLAGKMETPQAERKNSVVKEDNMGSQVTTKQDEEMKSHSELRTMEVIETEVESHMGSTDLMGSEKETEKLENVSSNDVETQIAVIKTLDDSKRETDEIISAITKSIHDLPDSLAVIRCDPKLKADIYDTPSDSSESDVVTLQDGGDFPDTKDCKVWGKAIEQNDSESVSIARKQVDERETGYEANSNGLERNCFEVLSANACSSVQLDTKQEESLVGEPFPVVSKDTGMDAVIIHKAELVEVVTPEDSVVKMTDVKNEAKLSNKDGVAVSFVADGSSEVRTLSIVENGNGSVSSVDAIRQPGWKKNHQISSGNTLSKDGSMKECDLFPRTY